MCIRDRNCTDTTGNLPGSACIKSSKRGWYVKLKDYGKVTAEPTVFKGLVYYPIYEPTKSKNKCSLGNAYICAADDECGTNTASQLNRTTNNSNKCAFVGQGVLSKIVVFANKLFANIAGQSLGSKKDLVTLDAAGGDSNIFRSSWRHNY